LNLKIQRSLELGSYYRSSKHKFDVVPSRMAIRPW
jgi:hypothetical protein